MTDNHPITPPPELVQQWYNASPHANEKALQDVATTAAQWGADQELEACINYFLEYDSSWGENSELVTGLRAARRPKPPSLKEQALLVLEDVYLASAHYNIIRQALEALPDD